MLYLKAAIFNQVKVNLELVTDHLPYTKGLYQLMTIRKIAQSHCTEEEPWLTLGPILLINTFSKNSI
jgi:hypothetical protein